MFNLFQYGRCEVCEDGRPTVEAALSSGNLLEP